MINRWNLLVNIWWKKTSYGWLKWVFHNSELWLISLSSDWEDIITIADKNLWATQVYHPGDDITLVNSWYFYQWWNNYGFNHSWPIETSDEQIDASGYGPGNYYSSEVFRTINDARDSSHNANLWWEETGTDEARRWPCPEWYHIPSYDEMYNLIITAVDIWVEYTSDLRDYLFTPLWWRLDVDWTLHAVLSQWFFHTSTLYQDNAGRQLDLRDISLWHYLTTYGDSIRPFKNEPVVPDNTREKLL